MHPRTSDVATIERLFKRQTFDRELQRRRSLLVTMFPDTGPWRRELYAKHH